MRENLWFRENPNNEAGVRIQDDRQHAGLPDTLGLQRWLLDSFPHGAFLWPLVIHRPSGLHIATCRVLPFDLLDVGDETIDIWYIELRLYVQIEHQNIP